MVLGIGIYSAGKNKVTQSDALTAKLLLGPANVNKVKSFSGPCYMIKCVLTFVSGVQESVLVDFISQNFA